VCTRLREQSSQSWTSPLYLWYHNFALEPCDLGKLHIFLLFKILVSFCYIFLVWQRGTSANVERGISQWQQEVYNIELHYDHRQVILLLGWIFAVCRSLASNLSKLISIKQSMACYFPNAIQPSRWPKFLFRNYCGLTILRFLLGSVLMIWTQWASSSWCPLQSEDEFQNGVFQSLC